MDMPTTIAFWINNIVLAASAVTLLLACLLSREGQLAHTKAGSFCALCVTVVLLCVFGHLHFGWFDMTEFNEWSVTTFAWLWRLAHDSMIAFVLLMVFWFAIAVAIALIANGVMKRGGRRLGTAMIAIGVLLAGTGLSWSIDSMFAWSELNDKTGSVEYHSNINVPDTDEISNMGQTAEEVEKAVWGEGGKKKLEFNLKKGTSSDN